MTTFLDLPLQVQAHVGRSYCEVVRLDPKVVVKNLAADFDQWIFRNRITLPVECDHEIYSIKLPGSSETFRLVFIVGYTDTGYDALSCYLLGLDTDEHRNILMLMKLKYG